MCGGVYEASGDLAEHMKADFTDRIKASDQAAVKDVSKVVN